MEYEGTQMVQNKREETLFKRIDKIESIIENVTARTKICLEFKLNGKIISRNILCIS